MVVVVDPGSEFESGLFDGLEAVAPTEHLFEGFDETLGASSAAGWPPWNQRCRVAFVIIGCPTLAGDAPLYGSCFAELDLFADFANGSCVSDVCQIPVLLIIFNRPDLTRRVFQRIREARPRQLYIAADGPRLDSASDNELCEEARFEASCVDWPCDVQRRYLKVNVGCKLAVSGACGWFFENVEEGIILEDDCLPDPSFFPYCTELLERYRDDPVVAVIGSNQFRPVSDRPPRHSSYYFSKYPHIWGWASWRRTWRNYDINMSRWNGDMNTLSAISNIRVRKHFARRFDKVQKGEIDTWDYQFVHMCLTSGSLAINPVVNLVENIGFDARATHTSKFDLADNPPLAEQMPFPLNHPAAIAVDEFADLYTETYVRGIPPNWSVSLIWSLRKRLLFFKKLSRL
jgi:hypothetical protein